MKKKNAKKGSWKLQQIKSYTKLHSYIAKTKARQRAAIITQKYNKFNGQTAKHTYI